VPDWITVSSWWHVLLVVVAGVVLLWLVTVAALYVLGRKYDDPTRLRDTLRLIPDVVRLLRRLAADQTLPRGIRVRIALLLVYLVSPLDLVPDFIPVVGHADDVLIVGLVLRSVARRAGVEALDRHWPGTPEGLRSVKQVAGLTV
jgi:uncharacterized membrane protein YkvA (DUF1232 family)